MKPVDITVFTPTYNRAYTLKRLYDSLENQTSKNFEWLVIDDGSIDETKSLLNKLMTKASFPTRYVYKENEGKSKAINIAAQIASGKYVFIVDSDDCLSPDAIETINLYCKQIEDNSSFAGVAGLRGDSNGKVRDWQGRQRTSHKGRIALSKEYVDATAIEYRYYLGIWGDRAEVIKRDILLKYPFPIIDGEKFIPEAYLWFSLARDGYKFRWFNKVIYYTEYLPDGLSKNMKSISRKNCFSFAMTENLVLSLNGVRFKSRIGSTMRYYKYCKLANASLLNAWGGVKNKFFGTIVLPYAFLVYCGAMK